MVSAFLAAKYEIRVYDLDIKDKMDINWFYLFLYFHSGVYKFKVTLCADAYLLIIYVCIYVYRARKRMKSLDHFLLKLRYIFVPHI